ncbi:Thioredoxin domain-containing protein 5 [Smittium mucronatum]|uniref:Thioredoxin domain-containing protein 5 n=1 Tax=Smittium mucronatum TaxID=133383 RepID=A0A1R0H0P4_9FUNG|nr:Thioredoxin domain-containing protein 5 [Smittium mucronatum]
MQKPNNWWHQIVVKSNPSERSAQGTVQNLNESPIVDSVSKGAWIIKFDKGQPDPDISKQFQDLAAEWASKDGGHLHKEIQFGTFDCALDLNICEKYNVKKFPSFLNILFGDVQSEVTGNFVKAEIESKADKMFEKKNFEYNPNVILDSKNFKQAIANETWFVKFYSPKCGFSKRLAPKWKKMAEDLHLDAKSKGIHFAEFDCLKDGDLCNEELVDGYPTLFLYNKRKQIEEYPGVNEYSDLVEYVGKLEKRFPQSVSENNSNDTSVVVEPKKTEVSTDKVPVTGEVKSLDIDSYEEMVKKEPMFIKFYSPTCIHCIEFAPNWIKLAQLLKGKVELYEVDCPQNTDFCNKQGINGYPTLKLVYKDKSLFYEESRDVELLYDFALDTTVQRIKQLNMTLYSEKFFSGEPLFVYLKGNAKESQFFENVKASVLNTFTGAMFYKTQDTQIEKSLLENFDPESPKLVALLDQEVITYKGGEDINSITEFINQHKTPYLEHMTALTQSKIRFKNNFVAILVLKDPVEGKLARDPAFGPMVEAISEFKKSPSASNGLSTGFAYTYQTEFSKLDSASSKLEFKTLPAVLIRSVTSNNYFQHGTDGKLIPLDKSGILSSLQDAFLGKLSDKPEVKKVEFETSKPQDEQVPSEQSVEIKGTSFLGKLVKVAMYIVAAVALLYVVAFVFRRLKRGRGRYYLPLFRG